MINWIIAPQFSNQKFKNPSTWNPTCPLIVEHMSLLNEEQLVCNSPTQTSTPKKFNLTQAERRAKVSLMKNNNIVIKKAVKGSTVVVENRKDYIKEGLRQLSDRKFYQLQEDNLTVHHNKLITEAVLQMLNSGEIDKKTSEYLIPENPQTPNFYLLPKIHKNQLPPQGRPIVSANQCPSERISQFVDHFIKPIVTTLPSYLRDSSHNYSEGPNTTTKCHSGFFRCGKPVY